MRCWENSPGATGATGAAGAAGAAGVPFLCFSGEFLFSDTI